MVVGTNIIIQCYFKQKRDGRQSWATLSWEQGSLLAVLRGLDGKLGIESASAVCKARTLLLENRKIKKRKQKITFMNPRTNKRVQARTVNIHDKTSGWNLNLW